MNAIQSLTDTDGLLSDLRDIALTRSTATRLQVRDVERAFAHPRAADALAPESVARQLEELSQLQPSLLAGFEDALKSVTCIGEWCVVHLGAHLPDFSTLTRLLDPLVTRRGDVAIEHMVADEEEATAGEVMASVQGLNVESSPSAPTERVDTPSAGTLATGTVMDRQATLGLIRQARTWFEQHEPSSPIPTLLRRAEQFVGKPYGEVIKAIPAELLAQWESEQ